mmetsp:Transcript_9534/g.18518  ORF Transcript_9534/g.18518 Transcript_9534/m.18518 type:complete len:132 (-) Transcript_9534:2364-2759(-)
MKDTETKTELLARRPNRGTLKVSGREIEQDFEQLAIPLTQRCLLQKRFNKKSKKGYRLPTGRKLKRSSREIEGVDAILGFASFLAKVEVNIVEEKEPVVQKRCLGRAATHVAIAQYIKYLQLQPSTPSTTS